MIASVVKISNRFRTLGSQVVSSLFSNEAKVTKLLTDFDINLIEAQAISDSKARLEAVTKLTN